MFSKRSKRIFLDHASGTPISESVKRAMNRFGTSVNPGGIYKEAVAAKVTLETSRRDIAALFGALPDEIVFVPGATEANNLAIMGTVKAWQDNHPDEIRVGDVHVSIDFV